MRVAIFTVPNLGPDSLSNDSPSQGWGLAGRRDGVAPRGWDRRLCVRWLLWNSGNLSSGRSRRQQRPSGCGSSTSLHRTGAFPSSGHFGPWWPSSPTSWRAAIVCRPLPPGHWSVVAGRRGCPRSPRRTRARRVGQDERFPRACCARHPRSAALAGRAHGSWLIIVRGRSRSSSPGAAPARTPNANICSNVGGPPRDDGPLKRHV
jgi:hypothetical protein